MYFLNHEHKNVHCKDSRRVQFSKFWMGEPGGRAQTSAGVVVRAPCASPHSYATEDSLPMEEEGYNNE